MAAERIAVGSELPAEPKLFHKTEDGVVGATLAELIGDKRALIVGVPGAYTSTCSTRHVPSLVTNQEALREVVDIIIVLASNCPHVMAAWAKSMEGAEDSVDIFASDPEGALASALGLPLDLSHIGMGLRCLRFALVTEGTKVVHVAVDDADYGDTDGAAIVAALKGE
eukprot:PLAT6984.1.p2 GENE.PLAT6984.1~~PLAT6984.1.p2  ORF type:complete len:168 (+),score=68.95 PLAT6984.1:73-576(+)